MTNRRATWFAAFQIIFLIGAIGFQLAINGANHRQDLEIQSSQEANLFAVRESQYRGCVLNGNTLRDQVRREFIDIKRKILIPGTDDLRDLYLTVAHLSAGQPVSDVLLQAAQDEQSRIDYMKKRIKTIKDRLPDVDCMEVYPPLEGQNFPHIKPPRNATSGVRPH